MSENVFTRHIGPLPMWGWLGVVGGVIVAYELYKSHSASASAAAGTAGTGSSTVPQFVNQTYVSPGPPSAPHGKDHDEDDEHHAGGHGHLHGKRHVNQGKGGGGGTGPPTIRDGGPRREVASGTESLNSIAKTRGTTVASIVAVTKASRIDPGNLKAFLAASAHPARKLPKGTVYYLAA